MLELTDLLGPYSGPLRSWSGVPLVVRLATNIDYPGNDVECWPWRGSRDRMGYCTVRADRRQVGVHRVVYEILVAPIPVGLHLDHTCHDPAVCTPGPTCPHRRCCNPFHCEPVTSRVNTLRGGGVGAKFGNAVLCVNGHEFDSVRQGRYRRCKECSRRATARWRARHC